MSQYCYMIIKAVLYYFLSFPHCPFFSSGSCQNTLHLVVISPLSSSWLWWFLRPFFVLFFDNLIALRITVPGISLDASLLEFVLCFFSDCQLDSTVDVDLDPVWEYLWGFSTVKLLSVSPIPYSPLEGNAGSPHSGNVHSPWGQVGYINYLEFCTEDLPILLIYLLIQLFMSL